MALVCFCSKFCPGRFPPLFPVNPVRSFCCNYDRGKAIRILDTPLMVMRKLELFDNGVKLFLNNIYYFNELALLDQLLTSAWTFLTLSKDKQLHLVHIVIKCSSKMSSQNLNFLNPSIPLLILLN